MQNLPTTNAVISNQITNAPVQILTSKQFFVFWDDMEMSWDSTDITWNQATDIAQVTNITV